MSRSLHLSVLTIAAIALSACADTPSAPTLDLVPSEAKVIAADATLKVYVAYEVWGVAAEKTTVKFTSSVNSRSLNQFSVEDNSERDLDKRPGYYEVKIAKDKKYSVAITATEAGPFYGPEKTINSNSFTVDFGTMLVPAFPSVQIDQYERNPDGETEFVAGGTFVVTLNGVTLFTVSDNDERDRNGFDGRIAFMLPTLGQYDICEVQAPSGYAALSPKCEKMTLNAWGVDKVLTLIRSKL